MLEIIYRIAELRGSSKDGLDALRLRKKRKRKGFEKNLFLLDPFEEKCTLSELGPANPAEYRLAFTQIRNL